MPLGHSLSRAPSPSPHVPWDPWSRTTCQGEALVIIHNSCALAHMSTSYRHSYLHWQSRERDGPISGTRGTADASPDHWRPCIKRAWRQVVYLFDTSPAAHALPGCLHNPMFRQSARGVFSFPTVRARTWSAFSLRLSPELHIGSWATYCAIGAPWQRQHRLSSSGGSALIHR